MDRLLLGRATVNELAEPHPMTLSAASQHVKILENAGLLKRTIEGRTHHCELDRPGLSLALTWIKRHEAFWENQLDGLQEFAEQHPDSNS